MSTVVERGLARCPRCVTLADYVFIESESGMRYEVNCRKCGERYGERSLPWTPPPRTGGEPSMQWPPDCEPVSAKDWRAEFRQRISVSAHRGKVGMEVLGMRTRALVQRARTQVRERRTGSKGDQTGG